MNDKIIAYKEIIFKKKNLYLILIIGILFLLLGGGSSPEKRKEEKNDMTSFDYASATTKKELEDILSKVDGAGKTEVMITYDAGTEKIIAQNTKITKSVSADLKEDREEEDSKLSEEKETVMKGSGNSQTPFVLKEVNPRVRGVLVIAEGADNEKVSCNIRDAVAAVLDVPYHRIQVLKKS